MPKQECININSQVPREVNVESILDGKVVTQQLEGDDVQDALERVARLWHADRLRALGHRLVVLVALSDDLRLHRVRGDLRERALDLGGTASRASR